MKLEDKNLKIRRQKCTIANLAQYKTLKKMFQGFKFTFKETFYGFFSYLLYSKPIYVMLALYTGTQFFLSKTGSFSFKSCGHYLT